MATTATGGQWTKAKAFRRAAMRVVTLPLWPLVPLGKQALLGFARRRGTRQEAQWLSYRASKDLKERFFTAAMFLAGLSIAADPSWPSGYRVLGLAYHRQGEHERARAVFEQGLAAATDNVPLLGALGDVLWDLQRYSDAETAYRRALALRIDTVERPSYLLCLARAILRQAGREDEAVALLEEAHTAAPHDTYGAMVLGECYAARGKHAEAITLFREVLEREPANPHAQYDLAEALTKLHRLPEATAAARRALDLAPDAEHARTLLWMLDWTSQDLAQSANGAGDDLHLVPPGEPLGLIVLEISLQDQPNPTQRASIAAVVQTWFDDGAAGRLDAERFRAAAGPVGDGAVLRWHLDLGAATADAVRILRARLSGCPAPTVVQLVVKQPTAWTYWRPYRKRR
jgi:tetratricopeptide (TPR) repeat protein